MTDKEIVDIGRSFPLLMHLLTEQNSTTTFICAVRACLATQRAADARPVAIDPLVIALRRIKELVGDSQHPQWAAGRQTEFSLARIKALARAALATRDAALPANPAPSAPHPDAIMHLGLKCMGYWTSETREFSRQLIALLQANGATK